MCNWDCNLATMRVLQIICPKIPTTVGSMRERILSSIVRIFFVCACFSVLYIGNIAQAAGGTAYTRGAQRSLRVQNAARSSVANVPTVNCVKTPMVFDGTVRPEIYVGNNLWRYVGSAEFARGSYIELTGRIFDGECVPVSNAVVEIWQLDSTGYDSNRYEYIPQSGLTLAIESAKYADKYFVGSGTAITDNLGRYTLYTIIPGTMSKFRAPHINFAINHKDFCEFTTQMYFPESHDSVVHDSYLRKHFKSLYEVGLLVAKKRGTSSVVMPGRGVVTYEFNIVLTGKSKYREY